MYGTEGFFEEQLRNAIESGKNLSAGISEFEHELNFNFICIDSVRRECLANLMAAGRKLSSELKKHAAAV